MPTTTQPVQTPQPQAVKPVPVKSATASFTVGERDFTLVVADQGSKVPEDTSFVMNDQPYRGSAYVKDFLKGPKTYDLTFSNIHCDYQVSLPMNESIYTKLVSVKYGYAPETGKCMAKIEPQEFQTFSTVKIVQNTELLKEISMNDIGILNYIGYAIFGVALMVTIGLRYIISGRMLIYTQGSKK